MRSVLFVCTGNICRSPMAEYLFRHRLDVNSGWTASSAGLMAGRAMPASQEGLEAMRELNIDMTAFRSQPVTEDLIDAADLVVVMTAFHREQLRTLFPQVSDKVFLLKSFKTIGTNGDLEDPIGQPLAVYRAIRDEIDAAMDGLLDFVRHLAVRGEKK